MISPFDLADFKKLREQYCFYLDLQDRALARTLSNRLQDLGLREEIFLVPCVTHVVRDGAAPAVRACAGSARRTRADAMLQRLRPTTVQQPPSHYRTLTVTQAILLLDRIYDNYFRFNNIKEDSQLIVFTKHFIKVEVLDRLCRPFYEEFEKWPEICLDPVVPKIPKQENKKVENSQEKNMTRRSKQKFKEVVTIKKEPKAGYCEICNLEYEDPTEHQQSPHHLAFVQNHNNYLSLDELIAQGADVATFLENATPLNGDRKMKLRNMCNGELEPNHTRARRSNRSQSPDPPINGDRSPRRSNGNLDEEKGHKKNGKRSSRKSDDHQYYKVVGVNTKLRSSKGFSAKKKESPTSTCNGESKPLVVKFRKVRQSELSVLSDEAEQFMFPKVRTSSTCSSSEDEMVKPLPQPVLETPLSQRKSRQARPIALKEESSEEDSWPVHKPKRKRRSGTYMKRSRTTRSFPKIKNLDIEIKREVCTPPVNEELNSIEENPPEEGQTPMEEELITANKIEEREVPLIFEKASDKCLRWEDGKLKYGESVEQLEFAFESVPSSEPWFETFKRQDENKIEIKNVTKLFDLYAKSPKLPYEMGQLPPLKPNCCPLSNLVKREEKEKKSGPSRSYGTRGNKEKIKPLGRKPGRKKSIATLFSLDTHPRKSPREHASTLAILGSVGLMNRRNPEDTKSTASEDTFSETHSNKEAPKVDTVPEKTEDVCQFLSNIFEDAAEYEVEHEVMEGEAHVTSNANTTDFLRLVNECDECDIIRQQITTKKIIRRGYKMKKKNRTGWPSKKKTKKDETQLPSPEQIKYENNSCDQFSVGSLSETDEPLMTVIKRNSEGQVNLEADKSSASSDDRPLRLDVKWTVRPEDKKTEEPREGGQSESTRSKKRSSGVDTVTEWLQPVVRVSRVDVSSRRLRSAGKPTARSQRLR